MNMSKYRPISEAIQDKMVKDEPTGDIRVWHDPSLITKERNASIEDEQQESVTNNKLKESGLNSALNKDERVFKLITKVKSGEYETIEDAEEDLEVSINTIAGYLKEVGLVLYNKNGTKYGSKRKSNKSSVQFKYYSCNPDEDEAELISESDHKLKVYKSTTSREDG